MTALCPPTLIMPSLCAACQYLPDDRSVLPVRCLSSFRKEPLSLLGLESKYLMPRVSHESNHSETSNSTELWLHLLLGEGFETWPPLCYKKGLVSPSAPLSRDGFLDQSGSGGR